MLLRFCGHEACLRPEVTTVRGRLYFVERSRSGDGEVGNGWARSITYASAISEGGAANRGTTAMIVTPGSHDLTQREVLVGDGLYGVRSNAAR